MCVVVVNNENADLTEDHITVLRSFVIMIQTIEVRDKYNVFYLNIVYEFASENNFHFYLILISGRSTMPNPSLLHQCLSISNQLV